MPRNTSEVCTPRAPRVPSAAVVCDVALAGTTAALPSLPVAVTETYKSSQLRGARVELLLKEFNAADFRVVESRAMRAGGG